MPLVQLHILEGRSPEMKKRAIEEVTEALHRSLGAPRENIRVVIYEIPKSHWAVGGVTMEDKQTKKHEPPNGS
ncbi:4-oxalocrotonate tautomerase [Kyrpidia spormannii]|uniref:Tautomerase n=1 Tax=Kyrpidia spormannii TaxID=2055160 RepID=A0A2K8N8J3_9BACL|nr:MULTISPECIES: 4-oxalocrotonate tautomerase [Kyrpidia]ATY85435.1 4-oxalocrotonate tautomerase [Kyrpidia spormannii]MCL6575426.1 4-oxalocrotonate tautomerase [Kyrpidia sp.]